MTAPLRGGGGGGAPPAPAPPPCWASACHPLFPACPPGLYSCRGGCRAAAGAGRDPVGCQWVSAAGGGGGCLVRAPAYPTGCSVCAVLGAADQPSVGRRQGRSVRAVHRGRFRGGRGATVSSVCLRPLLGLRGRGGEWGGPSCPLAPPPDG